MFKMILNEKTIRGLVESGESETLEFKRNFDKDAIETIAWITGTKVRRNRQWISSNRL
ncbi:MAG: hypothetical protein JSV88_09600 [Candidatus Aminicenantes bacterium]|nr:MAG: hypothetical protein JSV88_09600 [Candidatus Aminicenantes bacterium]